MNAKFPLKDGDIITTLRHGMDTIAGEIALPHKEPICWTLHGEWYRRSDGEEMTAYNGEVMTLKEFYSNGVYKKYR